MIAGVELDLGQAWAHRRESGITAVLALGALLLFGWAGALGMLLFDGWMRGGAPNRGCLSLGGVACAVTALPILILLMERLDNLRQPGRHCHLGGVLAIILLDK